MDPKKLRKLKEQTSEQLSEMKGLAVEALKANKDNTEAKELVAVINKELQERGHSDEDLKPVKVRARNWVPVDGVEFNEGQEGIISTKQYKALARHFEKVTALALLAAVLIGGIMSPWPAFGQQLTVTPLTQTNTAIGSPTNTLAMWANTSIASATASNYFIVIPGASRYQNLGFTWVYKLGGAGTTASIAHFDASNDGSNWFNYGDISLAGNGASLTTPGFTNIQTKAIPFFRLTYISNASAQTMSPIGMTVTLNPTGL